jgi:hypothetical protein
VTSFAKDPTKSLMASKTAASFTWPRNSWSLYHENQRNGDPHSYIPYLLESSLD